jgi:hypothetical protein
MKQAARHHQSPQSAKLTRSDSLTQTAIDRSALALSYQFIRDDHSQEGWPGQSERSERAPEWSGAR